MLILCTSRCYKRTPE